MTPDAPELARCDMCGDIIPVKSSRGGSIRPIRPGESCECGQEEFRLLSEAEVAELPTERVSGGRR